MKKLAIVLAGLTIASQTFADRYDRYDRWQERREDRRERMEDEGVVGATVDGSIGVADDVVQGTLAGLFGGGGERRRDREDRYSNNNERSHRYDYRNDGFRKEKDKDSDDNSGNRRQNRRQNRRNRSDRSDSY